MTIDNIHYGEVLARLDNQMPSNAWLTVAIKEGKNREIRHIMEYLGYPVSRLIRLSYGPFSLGNLEDGDVREVKTNVLTEQLGLARTRSKSRGLKSLNQKICTSENAKNINRAVNSQLERKQVMNIIGGEKRGSKLALCTSKAVRPTAQRHAKPFSISCKVAGFPFP